MRARAYGFMQIKLKFIKGTMSMSVKGVQKGELSKGHIKDVRHAIKAELNKQAPKYFPPAVIKKLLPCNHPFILA